MKTKQKEKKIFIVQPSYIPWLGFWEMMELCETFVCLDNVQFTRRDWRNRNRIKTPQGTQWLTIPIKSKGNYTTNINEILICNETDWRKKHLQALKLNYSKATHFQEVMTLMESVIRYEEGNLCHFLIHGVKVIRDYLGQETQIIQASDLPETSEDKQKRILEICSHLNASWYINGAAGKDLYQPEIFKNNGIELVFQNYHHPEYPQQWQDFTSHLSIVDLLFNCGKHSRNIISQRVEPLRITG